MRQGKYFPLPLFFDKVSYELFILYCWINWFAYFENTNKQ